MTIFEAKANRPLVIGHFPSAGGAAGTCRPAAPGRGHAGRLGDDQPWQDGGAITGGTGGCLAILAFTGTAAAATTTIKLKEPEKGSTFAFVDNAPKTKIKHCFR